MRVKNPQNYKLLGFRKSKTKNKMYDGIIINKYTKKRKIVPFGSTLYENFSDLTGLNLYPTLIHNDNKRRRNWIKRHKRNLKYKFSSSYMAYKYLWS